MTTNLEKQLDTLARLAEGETVCEYKSLSDYWIDLWAKNPSHCTKIASESAATWKKHPYAFIADGLMDAAIELADPEFDRLLEDYTTTKVSVPSQIKLRMLFVSICRGNQAAREKYVERFRRNYLATQRQTDPKMPAKLEVGDVRDVSLLQLNELLPVLEELQALAWEVKGGSRPVRRFRPSVDAAVRMFQAGATGLIRALEFNKRASAYQQRLELVYCLGCLRDTEGQQYLEQFYFACGTFGPSILVKLTAIEAIVYGARAEQLSPFLAKAIAERLPRGLRVSFARRAVERLLPFVGFPGDATLMRLLRGVYFAPRVSTEVIGLVRQCLEAEDEQVAALAWLSLTQQGVTAERPNVADHVFDQERLNELRIGGSLMASRRLLRRE